MNIADKTLQLKKDFDDVYKAGQSSMVDESKIIEKTVSGEYIAVDDVSEIPHEVKVKLTSGGKNLWTLGDVSFTTYRQNMYITLYAGKTYTLSAIVTSSDTDQNTCLVLDFTNEKILGYMERNVRSSITFTPKKDIYNLGFYASTSMNLSQGDTATFKDIMIEENDTVTEYEPYKETLTDYSNVAVSVGTNESEITQILTVNTDGTVEGVKSTSPYMYMTTDNPNVTINATYHKSYGMQTEYDRFWDRLQNNGELLEDGSNLFSGAYWDDEIYNPKYTIKTNSFTNAFRISNITDTKVTIDFSTGTGTYVFYLAKKLKRVPKIIVNKDIVFTGWFEYCSALEEIRFEGTIGKTIAFSQSTKLSKASILNIFSVLSGTVTGQTLTLPTTAVTNAFGSTTATEWTNLVATKTNWTISLV